MTGITQQEHSHGYVMGGFRIGADKDSRATSYNKGIRAYDETSKWAKVLKFFGRAFEVKIEGKTYLINKTSFEKFLSRNQNNATAFGMGENGIKDLISNIKRKDIDKAKAQEFISKLTKARVDEKESHHEIAEDSETSSQELVEITDEVVNRELAKIQDRKAFENDIKTTFVSSRRTHTSFEKIFGEEFTKLWGESKYQKVKESLEKEVAPANLNLVKEFSDHVRSAVINRMNKEASPRPESTEASEQLPQLESANQGEQKVNEIVKRFEGFNELTPGALNHISTANFTLNDKVLEDTESAKQLLAVINKGPKLHNNLLKEAENLTPGKKLLLLALTLHPTLANEPKLPTNVSKFFNNFLNQLKSDESVKKVGKDDLDTQAALQLIEELNLGNSLKNKVSSVFPQA